MFDDFRKRAKWVQKLRSYNKMLDDNIGFDVDSSFLKEGERYYGSLDSDLQQIYTRIKNIYNKGQNNILKNKENKNINNEFEHEVAISFAGENRDIAEKLAETLRKEGIKVFYDEFFKHDLWGKKLTNYFQEAYGPKARFVMPLISKYYPIKDWTDLEFSFARRESQKRKEEFILPIKLDDTKILGIHEDVGHLDYNKEGIDGIVREFKKKLYLEHKYIEKNPNRLIKPKMLKEPDRIIKPKIIRDK